MLQDPKSQRFAADFTTQWLELHKIDIVNPNVDLLTYSLGDNRGFLYTRAKPFLMQEGVEFFKLILDENLSLTNFIDSDFVVINELLNQLYQFKDDDKSIFPKDGDKKAFIKIET